MLNSYPRVDAVIDNIEKDDHVVTNSCVWIVIPTFNRVSVLSECLRTLHTQTYNNIKIIVVDDASTDSTRDVVKSSFPDVVLLGGDGRRWWSGCLNIGLSYIVTHCQPDDYFVSFNDDVIVDEYYIANFISDVLRMGAKAIVGSLAIDSESTDRVVFAGNKINWATGLWKGKSDSESVGVELIPSHSLPGRGVIFPVKLISEIGFYDDKNFPQYFGDEDFSLRALKQGYSLFVSRSAKVRSHIKMTGIGRHSAGFLEFIKSLFSIRSPNQLSRRVYFIARHCPWQYTLQFCIIDIIKVTTSYCRKYFK